MSRFTRWSKKFMIGDQVVTEFPYAGMRRYGIVKGIDSETMEYLVYLEEVGKTITIQPWELELVE